MPAVLTERLTALSVELGTGDVEPCTVVGRGVDSSCRGEREGGVHLGAGYERRLASVGFFLRSPELDKEFSARA
jgi:hypothetical protein